MRFQTPLVAAVLVRRYKRFLADVRLSDGREAVAHCANPGSMLGLAEPGTNIWLEPNDDANKKLKYGWRLVEHADGHFTGVDTMVPNRVLRAAFAAREVTALAAYRTTRAEVKYGAASRVDFLLSEPGLPDAYVEVKSATLSRRRGLAEFPDSVTARGSRHLQELAQMATQGHRAVMLFLVQRSDCVRFALAGDIDPEYLRAFQHARQAGVEVMCFGTRISPEGVWIGAPVELSHAGI
ncbi:MAG: DNA/RNA nuclease SfsA [Halocynthiibacter sp.]